MKKLITSIIVCLMMLVPLSAKGLDYLRSGEYAYYLDLRGNMNFFRGYMFIRKDANSGLIYIRNVSLVDGNESKIEIEVDDTTDDLILKNLTYVTNFDTKDLPEEHYQAVNDLLNFNSFYHINESRIGLGGVFQDVWEEYGYTLNFNYCKYIPFFKFIDITRDGDENSTYILNNAGIYNNVDEAQSFFEVGLRAFPTKTRDISKLTKPTAKATTVKLNGVTLNLDKNWAKEKKSSVPAYGFYLNKTQQAVIQVENLSKAIKDNGMTMDQVIAIQLLNNKTIDYSSIIAGKKDTSMEMAFIFYDESGARHYQFNLFRADGTVISLSAYADIYDEYREYFAAIWKAIER